MKELGAKIDKMFSDYRLDIFKDISGVISYVQFILPNVTLYSLSDLMLQIANLHVTNSLIKCFTLLAI